MKKRFLFLAIFIALCISVSVVTYFAGARTYTSTIEVIDPFPQDAVPEFTADEGLVRVTDYRIDGNKLIYTVESAKAGTGTDFISINLKYDEEKEFNYYGEFHAGWFDSVYSMYPLDFEGKYIVIVLFFAVVTAFFAVMLWAFIEKVKKAEYSYSMVGYGGAAFFVFWMIFDLVFIGSPIDLRFGNLLTQIKYSGLEFISLITPLTVIFSVAVTVSNIFLMIREGFRPVNALGILFSLLMIGGRILIYVSFMEMMGSEAEIKLYDAVILLCVTLLAYFESMLFSTVICAYLASRHKPSFGRDFLVILGCAIRRDGTLTPLLRGRVDSAMSFEKEQYEKTGRHAVFVPSGGQGSDEVISEGEAMKRYLVEQGVPEDRILPEMKSINTRENLLLSKEIIDGAAENGDYKAAFATTNYHVFRGYILSEKAGLPAEGISAKTKWYFFPNAFLREFVGLVVEKMKKHIIAVSLFVLFFVIFNFVIPL